MTVYFIQQGESGPIKIGYSNIDASARLGALQVGNPEKLMVLCEVIGDTRKESALHELFKASHIRGEWFYPTKDIMEFVSTVVSASQCAEDIDEGAHPLGVYLEGKGLSVAKFAQSVGTTRQTIFRIIRRSNRPSPELAKRIQSHTRGEVSFAQLYSAEVFETAA